MDGNTIQKLRDYCTKFAAFRELTTDGEGKNLHDIKNSFDYIIKYADENNLSSTVFGGEVASKAQQASNVLSHLWNCFDNLEKSLTSFCENQEQINNKG